MTANNNSVKISNDDPSAMLASGITGAHDISTEQKLQMIAEAAYYIAESQGFHGNDPQADWLIAEIEISKML